MAASKSVHQKAVVGRGKGRAAPPPGPLLLAAALSLTCFLVSDYLLYDETPCDGIGIEEQTFLQTHLWTAENGWRFFTLSRLLLSLLIFVAFCVVFACLLGLCGFNRNTRVHHSHTTSPM